MASYIVDIQGFYAPDFLPKEICIVAAHSSFMWHCMIRPPTSYERLPPHLKKHVDYVTENIHGLHWDLGYTLEVDALNFLKNTLKHADRVYIKGSERVKYLEIILKRPVIDLDMFDYRGPRALNESDYSSCSKYTHRCSRLRCAMKKALMYRDYLRRHKIESSPFQV